MDTKLREAIKDGDDIPTIMDKVDSIVAAYNDQIKRQVDSINRLLDGENYDELMAALHEECNLLAYKLDMLKKEHDRLVALARSKGLHFHG